MAARADAYSAYSAYSAHSAHNAKSAHNTYSTYSTYREPVAATAADHDPGRGRKRSRAAATSTAGRPLRTDESSTLRGRSPRRATSPLGLVSRTSSPSAVSCARQLRLAHAHARREHCPSRPASPPARRRQRSRTRSRSRGLAVHRPVHLLSRLRSAVLLRHDDDPANDDGV